MSSSSESDASVFDLSTLPEFSRRICESLGERCTEVTNSLASGYLNRSSVPDVRLFFKASPTFNASARHINEEHQIDIHIATILLLNVLFERLLSSPIVIPHLQAPGDMSRPFSVPFVKDLTNPSVDSNFTILLNEERRHVAWILQDFCATFILLHEIAHVASGHCQANTHYFSEPNLHEFFGLELWLFRGRYLKTSWEYDADLIAASILSQYVGHFHRTRKSPAIEHAFAFLGGSLEHLLGLVAGSLFAMFAYLSQMNYHQKSRSYHPQPMLRIKYIAQVLLRRMAADHAIDGNVAHQWQLEYMEQMSRELEVMNLFDGIRFDAQFVDTDPEVDRISRVASRLRSSCTTWSWLPLDVWETLGPIEMS